MKQVNPSLRTRLLKAFQLIELKRTTNTKPENNAASLQTMYQWNPFYFFAIFSKIIACVTSGIVRIYQYSIRKHFSICLDLDF